MANLTVSSAVDAFMQAASAAAARTTLGLGTGDSPTFAGLTAAGVFVASSGGNVKLFYNPADVSGGGSFAMSRLQCIGFFSGTAFGGSTDAQLWSPSANILYQRNGTNAQTFLLANTYTDDSNYERARFSWVSNILQIGTQAAGTGAPRAMEFDAGSYMNFNLGGAQKFGIGGSFNISYQALNVLGSMIWRPASSVTLGTNGDLAIEATSNTLLTIKLRGSDGTTRSGTIALS